MNLNRFLLIGLYFILSLIATAVAHAQKKSPYDDYFPLEKGNYWIYRGPTRWVEGSSPHIQQKEAVLTWRMEVVATVVRNRFFAAKIKGFPTDLAWYKTGKPRGDYTIVRVGSGHYYLLQGLNAWEALKKPERLPTNWLAGEMILDAPLIPGKLFGGEMEREFYDYTWFVDGESDFNGKDIKGMPDLENLKSYSLTFRTRPDHCFVHFVPNVGIVGYVYNHHGTTSETELTLIEVGLSQKSTAASAKSSPTILRKIR